MNKKKILIVIIGICFLLPGIIGVLKGDKLVGDLESLSKKQYSGEYVDNCYMITEKEQYNGIFLEVNEIQLKAGTYQIKIQYKCNEGTNAAFGVIDEEAQHRVLRTNYILFLSDQEEVECNFYLLEDTDDLKAVFQYMGNGKLIISDMKIINTTDDSKIYLFIMLCVYGIVYMFYLMSKKSIEKKIVFLSCFAIGFISSYPTLVDYMLLGEETQFVLLRIELLKEKILAYENYALFIPAILRKIGFSVQTAYHLFLLIWNVFTAVVVYFCIKNCFYIKENKVNAMWIGLIGSLLYTLSPCRIESIYDKGNIGEYVAITFLPCILSSIYQLVLGEETKKNRKRNISLIIIGSCLIFQADKFLAISILSLSFVFCVLFYKEIIRRKIGLMLVITFGIVLSLNIFSIVPILKYICLEDYRILNNKAVSTQVSPFHVGIALLVGSIFVIAINYWYEKFEKDQWKIAKSILGIQLIFICIYQSKIFPTSLYVSQLIIISTLLLTYLTCLGIEKILEFKNINIKAICIFVICGIVIMFSTFQLNKILLFTDLQMQRIYDIQEDYLVELYSKE